MTARTTAWIRDLDGQVYFGLREANQVRLEGPGVVRVLRGRAWLTVKGQPRDWFLVSGKKFDLPAGQELFLQGDPRCVVGWRVSFSLNHCRDVSRKVT